MIDDQTCRGGIADATDRLAATLAPDHLDRPVPTCPGWDLERLVGHTGQVHRRITGRLRDPDGTTPPGDVAIGQPPAAREIEGWFRAGADDLLAALAETDLDRTVATWTGARPARFWLRRMLHETTIHAWDGEAAVGSPSEIDPRVALDGVDEVLEAILPFRVDWAGLGATGETIHLHATDDGLADGEGEWLLTLRPEGIEVARAHAKGDVAVRGPVASLDLLLWGRTRVDDPTAGLTVFGDVGVLDRLRTASAF